MERGINLLNTEEKDSLLIGRNPVLEALKNDRPIDKIIVAKGSEGSIVKIIGMAKEKRIPVIYGDKLALDRVSNGKPHQGVAAYTSAYSYCEVEDILEEAKKRGEEPFIIILDSIEDPHNLGAIMRTAETSGAHGIIISKRRSAHITDSVAKASAGAVEYVKCAKVSNIPQTIEKLKDKGLWIYACDMGGDIYYKANLKGAIGIVIGSEGNGISKLVKEKCDFTVSIPMVGSISSLNASNAAAIIMYEVRRQRDV